MGNWRRTLHLGLSLFIACAWLAVASIAGDECDYGEPLLNVRWQSLPADPAGPALGEWRLPISAAFPDLITEARVQVRIFREDFSGRWKARIAMSFPDPKPFGIPFSFQKAQLSWEANDTHLVSEIDWSQSCTGPGRSLFPGQSWSTELELPVLEDQTQFINPVFTLWGLRN